MAASIVDLSPAAAQQLGVGEGAPVRIRLVTPTPQDQMALALRPGRDRADGRAAIVADSAAQETAGARQLYARSPPVRPATPPPGARYAAATGSVGAAHVTARRRPRSGYLVQVAAFSTRERAQAAARQVGGRIAAAGNLFRVQIGPFADAASAQRARDEAARHGYGDARILHIE